jgi:ABC-2 type transport system permease protein
MNMFFRVFTLIRKELQALLRDPKGRLLLIIPVILQTAIFPFAATLEVNNNTLGIFNEDTGAQSIELIQRLGRAKAFSEIVYLHSERELREAIDSQRALLVLRFPQDFSRAVSAGSGTQLQAILDGRRSNSAQIALGYVAQIVQSYQADRNRARQTVSKSELIVRNWYNPNLDYVRHIVPSLIAIITAIGTLVVTALSVAREREQGTFDQLLVSPLTPGMIMVGKTVPALLVAMFQGSIILAAGVFIYRIPF